MLRNKTASTFSPASSLIHSQGIWHLLQLLTTSDLLGSAKYFSPNNQI